MFLNTKVTVSTTEDKSSNYTPDEISVNQVLDELTKATSETLDQNFQVDWNLLKSQAKIFIDSIYKLETEKEMFMTAQLKNILASPEIAPYANAISGEKERFITQSQYMLMARFDEFLSNFRQEELQRSVLFVSTNKENNQILGTFEMSLKELILNADKHGRINNISKLRLTMGDRQSIEDQEGAFNQEHVVEAQMAYNGVINRLDEFYKKHKNAQKQGGLLMWKEKEWKVGTIINTGDIKEAYTSFLLDNHKNNLCKMAGGVSPFYSHDFIGNFFRNYISKVSNMAAIVEEDILSSNKQFAIKGKKAALPSLQQYLVVANYILSQPNLLTAEEMNNWIRNYFKQDATRNVEYSLKEITDQEIYDLLKSLQRNLNKT